MATISLKIGGKKYDIDCPAGQESHIMALAEKVDARIQPLLKSFVHASDAMVLVVLALMMQDEVEGLRKGNESAPESSSENSAQVDALIEQLIEPTIERMDRLAKRLEIL